MNAGDLYTQDAHGFTTATPTGTAVLGLIDLLKDPALSKEFVEAKARRIVAHAPVVEAWLAAIDSPEKVKRGLRQQQTARLDDVDFWLEEERIHADAMNHAREMRARIVAARPAEHDPDEHEDERGADEDADRISRERAIEEGDRNAPRVAS